MIKLSKIVEAHERLSNILQKTKLAYAPFLSQECEAEVYIKKENLQHTGSFKIRGAFNKIASLSEDERQKGVIAASAGNHAQGVAYSGRYFGIRAVIVMPEATPLLKVTGCKNLGAEVILKGDNYDEAYGYARELSQKEGLTFVHPFADDEVMAGQGTIALEMLEEKRDIDTIVVPVGGGGLISGVASAFRQMHPKTRIVGVCAKGAPAMYESYQKGEVIDSLSVKTIADGIAVRDTSPLTFEYIRSCVDELVLVDDEEIANAILFLLEKQKLVVEGAGAAGVAALLHKKIELKKGEKVATILSGGNIDVTMLSVIIQKGLIKSSRKMNLLITLVDKPGSLKGLTDIFSGVAANIVSIGYDRTSTTLAYGDANVTISLETKGEDHQDEIRRMLKEKKYKFEEIR